ncbi:MAG: ABC transporter ATP-binding protein [Desulfobacula sp.]|nr:ABC transporter ATP-binding protein [Desulfobacula sp.]
MSSKSTGITIKNLSLSFGKTEVLKNINLEIAPGEFFAFLGPSGSGKSTLLRAIAGFGPTPGGQILLGEKNVVHLPPWKRNVGMVFQSYALWPHMTVRKNVGFGLVERKVSTKEMNLRVDKALEMVAMGEYAERRPSQLSGGQQQRIAIARTIVIEPKVLLLDEPLSNLDANLRVQMRRDIRALQQRMNLTTIFVTHDQEEANTTSDRMAVLDNGILQQIGSPIELYDRPDNLFVAKFLGTTNILKGYISEQDGKTRFQSDSGINFSINAQQGKQSIIFRPQNARLAAQDEVVNGDWIELSAKIEYAEFLGSLIRYAVKVGKDILLVDEAHTQETNPLGPGEPVRLLVDRKRIQALVK